MRGPGGQWGGVSCRPAADTPTLSLVPRSASVKPRDPMARRATFLTRVRAGEEDRRDTSPPQRGAGSFAPRCKGWSTWSGQPTKSGPWLSKGTCRVTVPRSCPRRRYHRAGSETPPSAAPLVDHLIARPDEEGGAHYSEAGLINNNMRAEEAEEKREREIHRGEAARRCRL